MTTPWPDESSDALLGDVFEHALRSKERSYVLVVPREVMVQSRDAIKRWLENHLPGNPVMVVPEPAPTIDEWLNHFADGADLWGRVLEVLHQRDPGSPTLG